MQTRVMTLDDYPAAVDVIESNSHFSTAYPLSEQDKAMHVATVKVALANDPFKCFGAFEGNNLLAFEVLRFAPHQPDYMAVLSWSSKLHGTQAKTKDPKKLFSDARIAAINAAIAYAEQADFTSLWVFRLAGTAYLPIVEQPFCVSGNYKHTPVCVVASGSALPTGLPLLGLPQTNPFPYDMALVKHEKV